MRSPRQACGPPEVASCVLSRYFSVARKVESWIPCDLDRDGDSGISIAHPASSWLLLCPSTPNLTTTNTQYSSLIEFALVGV